MNINKSTAASIFIALAVSAVGLLSLRNPEKARQTIGYEQIKQWNALTYQPLADANTYTNIPHISLTSYYSVQDHQKDALFGSISNFFQYCLRNNYESYVRFRLPIPPARKCIPSRMEKVLSQLERAGTNVPPDIEDRVRFCWRLASFGLYGTNGIRYDSVNLTHMKVVLIRTNSYASNIFFCAHEFFSLGSICSSNGLYSYSNTPSNILAHAKALEYATATAIFKDTHSLSVPMHVRWFWDDVANQWIPDEFAINGSPLPDAYLRLF